jgi:hypothetical protein
MVTGRVKEAVMRLKDILSDSVATGAATMRVKEVADRLVSTSSAPDPVVDRGEPVGVVLRPTSSLWS